MGKMILAMGEPGTGKSAAIENLDPKTTYLIRPNTKDLPFKGSRSIYSRENKNTSIITSLTQIGGLLKKINAGKNFKTVIIEDITHFFNRRVMKDASLKGFDKWNELAVDTFNSILGFEEQLRDDLYVILVGHVEESMNSDGESKGSLLTPGKLLDRSIKISSYVTYVLHTDVREEDGEIKYRFLTNRDGGGREAKSPKGCLELLENNDYKAIIDKIEAYHN
jgi:hypothetical protein